AAVFAVDRFDRQRIDRTMSQLETLLSAGIADPSIAIRDLPLQDETERASLLSFSCGPTVPYAGEPIHQQIRRRAREHPGQVAAQVDDDLLTYGALDHQSDVLAAFLQARGIAREEIVGVCLDRGLDVFVALVAVLKAGAAFLMLDPTHPPNRVAHL